MAKLDWSKYLDLSEQVLDERIYVEGKGVCKVQDLIHSQNIISHKALLDEIHETYKEKNQKYGDSFTETVEKYGLVAAITRMHDKFSRIENIITQQAEDDEDERLVDSLKDLANYCLMTVMVLENEDD